jgi:hypothetical protein
MIDFKEVKCGRDLYHFIEKLNDRHNHPELSDYLISLWKISQEYRNRTEFQYSDMANMLQEAFTIQTLNVNWNEEINKPYENAQRTIANTPEYFKEIHSYEHFSRHIQNMCR